MKRACLILLFGLLAYPGLSAAQDYPKQAVTIIDPAAPGGISDIAARVIGEQLTKKWGQQVVVENRPGAGGSIGVGVAARAKPDGYTLLMTTNGQFAVNPAVYPSLPYDPDNDFIPISMVTNNPMLLVANINAPYNTFGEFVAAAKANPGQIGWASPGVGTWNHLAGEWLQAEAGIKLLHVPYKGGGPAGVAVAGGDVPVGLIAISSAMPHIRAGKMKALALSTAKRSSMDPSWQTIAELGLPKFDAASWVGLFVPAKTPAPIVRKIEEDVADIMAQPDVQRKFTDLGIEVAVVRSADFTKRIKEDQVRAKTIVTDAAIQLQ